MTNFTVVVFAEIARAIPPAATTALTSQQLPTSRQTFHQQEHSSLKVQMMGSMV